MTDPGTEQEAPVEEQMRFDRRLAHRPGWLPKESLDQYLASLPDVADKAAEPEE